MVAAIAAIVVAIALVHLSIALNIRTQYAIEGMKMTEATVQTRNGIQRSPLFVR